MPCLAAKACARPPVAGRHRHHLGVADVPGGADDGGGRDPRRARAHRCGWATSLQATAGASGPTWRSHRQVDLGLPLAGQPHRAQDRARLEEPREDRRVVGCPARARRPGRDEGGPGRERQPVGQGQPRRGQPAQHLGPRGVLDPDRVGLRPPGGRPSPPPRCTPGRRGPGPPGASSSTRSGGRLVLGAHLGMEVDPAVVGGAELVHGGHHGGAVLDAELHDAACGRRVAMSADGAALSPGRGTRARRSGRRWRSPRRAGA